MTEMACECWLTQYFLTVKAYSSSKIEEIVLTRNQSYVFWRDKLDESIDQYIILF